MSYNNSDVIQCLRQYEMFANSLKLVRGIEQREMIIKQLTKLEQKIISLTNETYVEEYNSLADKKCELIEDEKRRITMLIDLINQRLAYIEKRCNDHYSLTGESIDVETVLGVSELDELENKVRVIDKYTKNVKLIAELNEEVKNIANKILLAKEKIDISKSVNTELENTFISTFKEAFEELKLYDLLDIENDVEYAYYETEKSLTMAELNLEAAKTSPVNILTDCQEMYDEVSMDYANFKDKLMTIRLIKIFDAPVSDYDSLLEKRKTVNELLKYIKNQPLLDMVGEMVNTQYNTIIMEGQDINTYNDLNLEKERKLEAIDEMEAENNSEEFQNILKVLIANEKRRQEKILEEQKRIQEEEKRKKLELERKRQEEILKRQRIIEEARKKEMEKRTKQMLEEQQNSVLQPKKKENTVNFEDIKDSSTKAMVEEKPIEKEPERNFVEEVSSKYNIDFDKEEDNVIDEDILFKNKIDIEKELFEEFNNSDIKKVAREEAFPKLDETVPTAEEIKVTVRPRFDIPKEETPVVEIPPVEVPSIKKEEPTSVKEVVSEKMSIDYGIPQMDREELADEYEEELQVQKVEEHVDDRNKLPDMSLDEYMKNFDANKIDDADNLFADDDFPSIPV